MANTEHLEILKKSSVKDWNKWRELNPYLDIDLSGAELDGMNLKNIDFRPSIIVKKPGKVNLSNAKLTRAKLNAANLIATDLHGADLRKADLRGANLTEANLISTNFNDADLREVNIFNTFLNYAKFNNAKFCNAYLRESDFTWADLSNADLSNSNMSKTILYNTNLSGANLKGADLTRAHIVKTRFDVKTNLNGARVYGVSVWDSEQLENNKQQLNLIITEEDKPVVTIDNLEVAQFIYLILNNEKIRNVLDTIGKKGVLILGRFGERKNILEAIRAQVRRHNFLPIVFDFERPTDKDFSETVLTLAGISRFIIADISKPHCVPHELELAVPNFMIPFVPLIQKPDKPYAMFQDLWKKHRDWVLDPLTYSSVAQLERIFEKEIIFPANKRRKILIAKKAEEIVMRDADELEKKE